jgi:hypothetical protein
MDIYIYWRDQTYLQGNTTITTYFEVSLQRKLSGGLNMSAYILNLV